MVQENHTSQAILTIALLKLERWQLNMKIWMVAIVNVVSTEETNYQVHAPTETDMYFKILE